MELAYVANFGRPARMMALNSSQRNLYLAEQVISSPSIW
jgi:hypothetical protein